MLEVEGVAYIAGEDKAEQFAKTYRGFSKLPKRKEDRAVKKKVREARKRARESYTLQECEQDVMAAEVLNVIRQAKNNKAAGQDDVPYEMLKHLGSRVMEMLVHIYQRHFLSGRKTKVEVNNARSKEFTLNEGLPRDPPSRPCCS